MREGTKNGSWQPQRPGDRFGHYVLVAFVQTDQRGQRWRVRCDCGSEQEHSLARLRLSAKRGEIPQCRRCGHAQRRANGGARFSGLCASAARRGDRRAFVELEPVDIDAELP